MLEGFHPISSKTAAYKQSDLCVFFERIFLDRRISNKIHVQLGVSQLFSVTIQSESVILLLQSGPSQFFYCCSSVKVSYFITASFSRQLFPAAL